MNMWKVVLRYFILVVVHHLKFAVLTETTALIIDQVCVPYRIAELERYLEQLEPPEVPILNSATYPDAAAVDGERNESDLVAKDPESLPFGSLPDDWKRLRLLHDLLILPRDDELKSKLPIVYEILILAHQRLVDASLNKDYNDGTGYNSSSEESHSLFKSYTDVVPTINATEIFEGSAATEFNGGLETAVGNTKVVFDNTKKPSMTSTIRQRLHRSTDSERGYTDSSVTKVESEAEAIFDREKNESIDLSATETNANVSFEPENTDFKSNSIPQLEEIDLPKYTESNDKELRELVDEENANNNTDSESSKITDFTLVKIVPDLTTQISEHSSSEELKIRTTVGISIDRTKEDVDENLASVFERIENQENATTWQTVNERSSKEEEEVVVVVTSEEIKPDVRNENLETITALSNPFTTHASSLVSEIDEKIVLNPGEDFASNFIDESKVFSSYFPSYTSSSTTQETMGLSQDDEFVVSKSEESETKSFTVSSFSRSENFSYTSSGNKVGKEEEEEEEEDSDRYTTERDESTTTKSRSDFTEFADSTLGDFKSSTTVNFVSEDVDIGSTSMTAEFSNDPLFSSTVKSEPELAETETTRKWVTLRIGDLFSNIPRPVETHLPKNGNPELVDHVSRVQSFQNEKDSAIDSISRDFYDIKNHLKYRIDNSIDQSDEKIELGMKLSGFRPGKTETKTRLRNRRPSLGKTDFNSFSKREGINTDIEKLYRWFYRLGQNPENSSKRIGRAEIKCDNRN